MQLQSHSYIILQVLAPSLFIYNLPDLFSCIAYIHFTRFVFKRYMYTRSTFNKATHRSYREQKLKENFIEKENI